MNGRLKLDPKDNEKTFDNFKWDCSSCVFGGELFGNSRGCRRTGWD